MNETTEVTGTEVAVVEGDPIFQFFGYKHLPLHLQSTSAKFYGMAEFIIENLPNNSEREMALRKLLEAKDCAVRAKLYIYA